MFVITENIMKRPVFRNFHVSKFMIVIQFILLTVNVSKINLELDQLW